MNLKGIISPWFYSKVGDPQLSSANRKSADLRTELFLDLRTFSKCGNLRIYDLRTIYFCNLRIQLFFADLKLPQIHYFYPYKFKL
jgi:hypothetical protein